MTKNGYDWTGRYIQLAGEAEAIEAKDFIIDGEAITINEAGLSDFHALQSAVTSRKPSRDLVAFDLLHLNGHDLRNMPVEDRREILEEVSRPAAASSSAKQCRAPATPSITWSTRLDLKAWF
ncbi:hypothetical protein [Mesorhizobium sp.]|uniref:ATP-dependent DNA ligase n=1 Tax=Mesorhizobium sp. TaxID=1871066 RepID=UPI00345D152C